MAEIVLTFVVEEMLKKLASFALEGIDLAWGLKGKLQKLNSSLAFIRSVLHDAEEKQGRQESVKSWLQKLRDVAYEAEDVLDEFVYEVLRQKVEGRTPSKKVSNFFSASSNPIAFRIHMGKKIKKINDELAEIKNDAVGFGLISAVIISSERAPQTSIVSRVTHSFLDKSEQIIGRDNDVSKVIELLNVSNDDDQVFSVVPIVGMGGLGKTTLAKLVVKEIEGRKLFGKTIWVCVSQNFNEQNILGEMLQNLMGTNIGGLSNLDTILRLLREGLQGKKFLLVLDDVWNEEIEKWESLKKSLSIVSGSNGNVIIVTTRKQQTASIMETPLGRRHELKGLEDEECWSIIREVVDSGNNKASISGNLEVIGKNIARKCGGVPLAARMLGGLIRNSKEERHWLSIKNSHVLDSVGNDAGILPILKLSFDHLPRYVKPCFAYCAVFPEDHRIGKDQLIQLWMAEGLLGTTNDPTMEDIGSKYFDELLASSFFQDVQEDSSPIGSIISFKMHDLVHDLSLSISKQEVLNLNARPNFRESTVPSNVRHLNLSCDEKTTEAFPIGDCAGRLRSLFVKGNDGIVKSLGKFGSLRTLNLVAAHINELPVWIGKLKHLRFLDVSETKIKELPESTCKLYNLQTLRLEECKKLERIPGKMKNMMSLRHFCLSGYHGEKWPRDFSFPNNLVDVRLVRCDNMDQIPSLGHLPNLQTLQIKGMSIISCIGHEFYGGVDQESNKNNIGVKKSFPALKEFRLEVMEDLVEWMLPAGARNGEQWIIFPSLQVLFINECGKLSSIPGISHMPSIVRLIIQGCDELSELSGEFNVGTPIEEINMRGCGNVMSMPSLQYVTCLKRLRLVYCRKLTSLPVGLLSSCTQLQELEVYGCLRIDEFPIVDMEGFLSLERMRIGDIRRSRCLPIGLGSCTTLKELSIWGWDKLDSVPDDLGKLTSLVELMIYGCPRLTDIPEDLLGGHSTRLKHLRIGGFWEELEAFPVPLLHSIQNLNHTLETLHINGWRKLESLPNQLQQLTSLKELVIDDFDGIETLPEWLGNLSSLRSISIGSCRNLKHLPSSATMQRLSKLERIHIFGCPFLRENCREETGSEWSKIRHLSQF